MSRKGEKDPTKECYFSMINLKGIIRKNKYYVQYPDVPSAIKPTTHGPDLPLPEPDGYMEYSSDYNHTT